MEVGLIPETLEEFERQFGRELVAGAAAQCHVSPRRPNERLADADRRALFKALMESDAPDAEDENVSIPAATFDASEVATQPAIAGTPEPAAVSQESRGIDENRLERLERDLYRLQQLLQLTELRAQQAEKERDRAQSELGPTSAQLNEESHLRQQAERALDTTRVRLESAEKHRIEAEAARSATEDDRARLETRSREQQSQVSDLQRTIQQLQPEQLERLKRRMVRVEAERDAAIADVGSARTKLTDLRREHRDAASKLSAAERTRASLERKLDKALARNLDLEAALAKAKGSGLALLDDARIRAWASKQSNSRRRWTPPTDVVVSGYGPLPSEAFAALLDSRGIQTAEAGDPDVAVMIVGREGWLVDDIEDQIRARAGKDLFIYSQEMFLTALLVGADPFDTADTKTLLDFATDHTALRYCIDEGFKWPSIPTAKIAKLLNPPVERVGESPLHKMGYIVGRNGLDEASRREILECAFGAKIPFVESKEYMSHWGQPGTRRRLRRMARLIAWLIAGARGRDGKRGDMSVAIAHWSSDLAWMHQELYETWMSFKWPGTGVDGSTTGSRRKARA
jgi:hypothetical protein